MRSLHALFLNLSLAVFGISSNSGSASAQSLDLAPLAFGVKLDGRCSSGAGKESTQLAAIAAKVVGGTALSLIGSALEKAGKDGVVRRGGSAAGALYDRDPDGLLIVRTNETCVRFWYGRVGSDPIDADETVAIEKLRKSAPADWPTGVLKDDLLSTLYSDNHVELPYVYGEVAIAATADGTALLLDPQLLLVRPSPDLRSRWGQAPSYVILVELRELGQSEPFAIYSLGPQKPVDASTLLYAEALSGRASGYFPVPKLADAPSKAGSSTIVTGRFTANVLLTATQPGSALARAFGTALVGEKDDLLAALIPQSSSEKAAAAAKALSESNAATLAVFDAELTLSSAEEKLLAEPADSPKRPGLQIAVTRAKYEVDIKRELAGLSKKYNVSP